MKPDQRPNLVRTFGLLHGVCNICGQEAKLTEDHTPPKGWARPKQVELRHVVDKLGMEGGNRKRATRSQNGLKYRTLCGPCNNGLLGARYDPALIMFANEVARTLQTTAVLSSLQWFSIQPQAVMRAVLGHMCAQGVGRYAKGPLTEAVRQYMLDENLPLPEGLSFYYWAYPFRHQVIIRDAVFTDFSDHGPVMFWLLKAYPLAFMVTWTPAPKLPFSVQTLDPLRAIGFAETASVPLRLDPLTPELWPEAPPDDFAVLYGPEAVTATSL